MQTNLQWHKASSWLPGDHSEGGEGSLSKAETFVSEMCVNYLAVGNNFMAVDICKIMLNYTLEFYGLSFFPQWSVAHDKS